MASGGPSSARFRSCPAEPTSTVGLDRATDRVLTEIIFGPGFWTVFLHNLGYFFVGPVLGPGAVLLPGRLRAGRVPARAAPAERWQGSVLRARAAEILLMLVWIPYNYFGGGGVLGNRYFMNIYGLFLFLLPPIGSVTAGARALGGRRVFTAQITLNPFYSSFHPAEHATHGPLRLLPVELSLVNDLPVNTSESRVATSLRRGRPFQMYFLDANAYCRERQRFWVRGPRPPPTSLVRGPGRGTWSCSRSPTARWPTVVTVESAAAAGRRPGGRARPRPSAVPLGEGFPYVGPRVWKLSITQPNGLRPDVHRGRCGQPLPGRPGQTGADP